MNNSTVEIIFEEGPCFVLNKPPGLLTQAPPGIDSLESRFKALLRRRLDRQDGKIYLGLPHRLDRPVSGAILFARHVRAARRLSEQFEARTIRKVYWALVEGEPAKPSGTWRDFLRKIPGEAKAEQVDATHPDAREAVLHFKRLASTPAGSLLEIELETGRMHQIRIQAASRGLPIVGDALYGAVQSFGEPHADDRLRAIALHGRRLEFRHPMHHEPRQVEAPLPDAWRSLGLGPQA
ncbi:MAG: RluA family pseudouridine synthase [Pirellulales bacterium]